MIDVFLILGSVYITSLVIHELGHYGYAKANDRKAQIMFSDDRKLYTQVIGVPFRNQQLDRLYASGIVSGLLFLMMAWTLIPYAWVLFFPYLLGCWKDFKGVLKI